ncbi:MAG: protein kinase, partial [Myxococcales bacterium]|nr:protein kinase [Myxococcales bacterium]
MSGEQLPQPGDLIGVRYRIESLLGQGGMGAVYAAVNQATGRAVAIKWMLPGAARSKESLARFLAEARATAKIEHPNVIQILDVGQDGDAPFLVMERLRGESLAD